MPYKDEEIRRTYHKQYNKRRYEENKDEERKRLVKRKSELRSWVLSIKRELKCEICGESDPRCLDFHHIDRETKIQMIANVVNQGWGKERILQEMQKCKVLCANCHRKLHSSIC